MPLDDDEAKKLSAELRIGEELDLLSVEELEERIALLEAEIDRFRQAIEAKQRVKSDAESFFRN